VVDLTLPLYSGMPVYPGDPEVAFARRSAADPGAQEYALAELRLGTHTGTHLDAPAHVIPGGAGVDTVPLAACVGRACVVDCTGLDGISLPALRERIPDPEPGSRLLLRTDWDLRFGTEDYYTGFPGLTLPAACWLAERRIALLGLETPSVCHAADHAAHVALLEAGVIIVEGLARLRNIGAEECWFAALPLPLAGLDSSPVRAVAWVPLGSAVA